MESGTQHPLAVAVKRAAEERELPLIQAENFQTEAGLGITAAVTWQEQSLPCALGNQRWMEKQEIAIPSDVLEQARSWGENGKTPIFVALEDRLVGLLAIADVLREDAADVVADLQRRGLSVKVLTGDRQEVASAIATQPQPHPRPGDCRSLPPGES